MDVREKIIALVFDKYNLPDYQMGDIDEVADINIFEDLGFDSIQFVELIVKIENEFNIEFDDDVFIMENFTISNIVNIVNGMFVKNGGVDDGK